MESKRELIKKSGELRPRVVSTQSAILFIYSGY